MSARILGIAAAPAALAIALIGLSAPVSAQSEEATPLLEGITVTAPRIVHKKVQTGRREWVTELTARVSYADLDLAKPDDLKTMEGRVSEAATRICQQLSGVYPDGKPSVDVCTQRAIDGAMTQVREIVELKAAPVSSG